MSDKELYSSRITDDESSHSTVDLRADDTQRDQVIQNRLDELKALGFSDDFISSPKLPETLFGANTSLVDRIDSLKKGLY